MARKIEVKQFNSSQSHHVKRSIAECLVARLLAEWIVRDVAIRMLPPTAGLSRLQYYAKATSHDSALPSCELPGLSFMLQGKKVWGGKATREWLRSV